MTTGRIPDAPSGEATIETAQLAKHYGDTVAVAGVSFQVRAGEIFGYLGRNGSGKTTTVRVLTTLTRPTSGQAWVAGIDVRDAPRVRAVVGVTMQEAALDDAMTAREHLRFVAGLAGASRRDAHQRAGEVLELVGLADVAGSRIGTYSGGMKRRLDIASALLGRPTVLFLDEPTTGLDPQSRRAVWDEIRAQRDAGTTVFLTTQYLEEADQLTDRVAIVDAGRIIAQGTPQQLKATHGRTTISLTHDAEPAIAARALAGLDVTADRTGRTVITLDADGGDQPLMVLDRLRAGGLTPTHLAVTETSLEDVFVRLTGSGISNGPGGVGDAGRGTQ